MLYIFFLSILPKPKEIRKYLSNTNDVTIINYVIGLEYGETTEFVRMVAVKDIFYNIKMKMKNLSHEVILQNRQGMYISPPQNVF